MLSYRIAYLDGSDETIEADAVVCGDGVACFRTATGRLLVVVPLATIRRVDVDWPEAEARGFDVAAFGQG